MLRKIDDAIYLGERILTVALVGIMALAVFLDVVHRKFSELLSELDLAIIFVATAVIAYGAFRTAELERTVSRVNAAVYALLTAAGLATSVGVLLWALPNGLIFSQKMALCMMLWVGFLGASMATREGGHIVFEVADRIWPVASRALVRKVAAGVAIAFCLGLAALTISYTSHEFVDWRDSDGVAGVFEGFPAPIWFVYGFLAVPLAVMAFRFALYGVMSAEIDAATEETP